MSGALRAIETLFLLAATLGLAAPASAQQPPALERRGGTTQLIVDGRPFLILGGELANSSASSPHYMVSVWPRIRAKGLNTLLAPVSWELRTSQLGLDSNENIT